MLLLELSGLNILFLWPEFFGYERNIKEKMEELGANVIFYDERPIKKPLARAVLKIHPKFLQNKTEKYYSEIMGENKNKKFDYIIVGRCDVISEGILNNLKNTFCNSKFILYLGDSIRNIVGIKPKIKYFDKILTFDHQDLAENSNLEFLPYFFSDHYRSNSKKNDCDYIYDISFIGTIHSDRYKIIKRLLQICNEYNLESYIYPYLQSEFMYYYYRIFDKSFKKSKKKDFEYNKINPQKIVDVYNKSKCILDIQHTQQSGLTMRTFETLGMHKKIITTNSSIAHYDFYNPNNILIIDRENVKIPLEFFESEYIDLPESIYEKYSLKNWVINLLK